MKELEQIDKTYEEIQAVKPIIKENQLIGRLIPKKGHRCYEINVKTGEMNEVVFDRNDITILGQKVREIKTKPDCVYVTALNKRNAGEKMKKIIQQKIYSMLINKK